MLTFVPFTYRYRLARNGKTNDYELPFYMRHTDRSQSWLWAVELIPLSTRGPANALATAANWLANFIVVLCTPVMFGSITWRTYVVYAVL